MSDFKKHRLIGAFLIALCACAAAVLGGGIGVAIAQSDNIPQTWQIGDTKVTLPTEILDRNGRLLSQFSGSTNHRVIPITDLPKYVVYALLTREDQNFFKENAFSIRGTLRAAWNIFIGHYFSGGSTITQQLAGTLYANRDHVTITRKLRELWYAFQIEKRLTKWQILGMYLNTAYFGRNNYGIEAASQYYFGHPANKLTLAESVMLIIQLANPARYYWLRYPDRARIVQHLVLEEMVSKGYVTQAEADQSDRQFWQDYPYSRAASVDPFAATNSKAPYFTEYVRRQLDQQLYGRLGFLRDGLVVHTTLNLGYQRDAQAVMRKYIAKYNGIYEKNFSSIFANVNSRYVPDLSLLGFSFNMPQIERVTRKRDEHSALSNYLSQINPGLNALSMVFNLRHLAAFTAKAHSLRRLQEKKTTVEGALITLDNHTGEILAMVGGYNWKQSQFNRAVDARLQEGSSIKPLYYSAAISSGRLTVASRLYDGPVVFWNPDGTPYRPRDFLGQWQGSVSLRWALQDSINVPSLEVLQTVGFTKAIARISRLLGLEQYKNNPSYFPHLYPLGLGIIPVAPINMARAYAVFANQGKEVDPIAIKFVQDRQTGKVVLQPERALRERQLKEGNKLQIMSPQAAYVMVNLLKSVVVSGDLWQTYFDVGGWGGMPMAGKTGTTQNWDDAWTVGFSPYYTTAVWFGFDHHGSSLGLGLTGATGAGPVWARYMKDIDAGLPVIAFPKPSSGLVYVRVDGNSGLLPTRYSTFTKKEIFIAGTEPKQFDTLARYRDKRARSLMLKLQDSALIQGLSGKPASQVGTMPQELSSSGLGIAARALPPASLNGVGPGQTAAATGATSGRHGKRLPPLAPSAATAEASGRGSAGASGNGIGSGSGGSGGPNPLLN
ncbi:MAG TPA: PBP1A family penicillin-binding protein [Spirochaetia bacterium]|nr:PBP1A family penicillin-binding protein [Spirochaetia bacterium]